MEHMVCSTYGLRDLPMREKFDGGDTGGGIDELRWSSMRDGGNNVCLSAVEHIGSCLHSTLEQAEVVGCGVRRSMRMRGRRKGHGQK